MSDGAVGHYEGSDRWIRHPADRARLVAALAVLTVGCALVAWRPHTVRAASSKVYAAFSPCQVTS